MRGRRQRTARRQARAAGSVARRERGDQASRPRRAHHGLLLGHRGPAVRAAQRSASHRSGAAGQRWGGTGTLWGRGRAARRASAGPGTRVSSCKPGVATPFSFAGWSGRAPRRAAGGPAGIAAPDGTEACPRRLESPTLSARLRARGAPLAGICPTLRPVPRRPVQGVLRSLAPRLAERRRGRPGAGLKPDRGDVGHLATTSHLEREGREPPWRGPGADRSPEAARAPILPSPEPDCPRNVPQGSIPLAGRRRRAGARFAQPPGWGPSHPSSLGRRRTQFRTQIPLSFGIASLTFTFRGKTGPTIWTKRCGLNNCCYPPLCRVLEK